MNDDAGQPPLGQLVADLQDAALAQAVLPSGLTVGKYPATRRPGDPATSTAKPDVPTPPAHPDIVSR